MIRFALSIDIERPVGDVFAFVTDPARLPEWQTNVVDVVQETEGPLRVGTRLREVHSALGRPLRTLVEVVEHEPDRLFALKVVDGLLPIDGRWEFAELDPATTRVTFTAEGRAPRLLRPVEGRVARGVERQMLAHHHRLKRVLESG